MTFDVALSSAATRSLDRMPAKVVDAVAGFVYGPLAGAPLRMGKPLKDDLEGLMSACRGSYRILYRVDEASQSIVVVRIAHRALGYRPR